MQIKLFTAQKSIEIALKYAKLTKSIKMSKTRQKLDLRMEAKIKMLFLTCIKITAMHSICRCCFPIWRKSPLDHSLTYFGPALDPPLGEVCRKALLQVQNHEFFMPTKFREHPSSGSVGKADFFFLIHIHG